MCRFVNKTLGMVKRLFLYEMKKIVKKNRKCVQKKRKEKN
jgi:hypothetical protein